MRISGSKSELEYLQTNALTKGFMSTEFEEIGHVFDNRYLVEELGKGSMATVYLVSDTFEERVALKVIPLSLWIQRISSACGVNSS